MRLPGEYLDIVAAVFAEIVVRGNLERDDRVTGIRRYARGVSVFRLFVDVHDDCLRQDNSKTVPESALNTSSEQADAEADSAANFLGVRNRRCQLLQN